MSQASHPLRDLQLDRILEFLKTLLGFLHCGFVRGNILGKEVPPSRLGSFETMDDGRQVANGSIKSRDELFRCSRQESYDFFNVFLVAPVIQSRKYRLNKACENESARTGWQDLFEAD